MENILTFVQNNYWWLAPLLPLIYEWLSRKIKTHNNVTLSQYLDTAFPKFVAFLDKLVENKIKKP